MIPQPGAQALPASGSGIPRLDFVTYQVVTVSGCHRA